MNRMLWLLTSVMLLVAGACTSGTSESGQETEAPDSGESSSTTTPGLPPGSTTTLPGGPAGFEALADLAGRLAVTDRLSLTLMDPNGANPELIDEAPVGLISQPTWSPDGAQIAWSRFDETGSVEFLVLGTESSGGATSEAGERGGFATGETSPVYLQWTDDAARLGFLQNGPDGIDLFTVAVTSAAPAGPIQIDTGTPFYFSWAPDNRRLATHRSGEVEVRDGSRSEALLATTQSFTATDWLNNDVLAVRDDKLVLVDAARGLLNELAVVQLPTEFVLHPDAGRVAYLGPGADVLSIQDPDPEEPPPSPEPGPESPPALRMLELGSDLDVAVTTDPVLAWEWSPDGNRLAYLGPSTFTDGLLRWYFWEDGQMVGATSEYRPSETELRTYLPFFAQYAQSHSRWSPDGEAFAFAGTVDTQSGVWIHVIDATPQSIRIADGDFVTWSPENVQGGGGVSPL